MIDVRHVSESVPGKEHDLQRLKVLQFSVEANCFAELPNAVGNGFAGVMPRYRAAAGYVVAETLIVDFNSIL